MIGAPDYTIEHDVLWPRDAEHRYRIYARLGDELTVLAACPEPGGIGEAIVQLHADFRDNGRDFGDVGRIGVLDVMPDGEPHPKGTWIIPLWDRGA